MATADRYERTLTRPSTGSGVLKPKSPLFYKQPTTRRLGGATRPSSSTTRSISSSGGGAPSVGAYGGGGGYGAPAVAAPAPRVSLKDFIDKDFGYRQAQDEYGESGRRIREFDAESKRMRGEVERDQGVRREQLTTDINDESLGAADDFANRGLLRSGGIFQAQDKINRSGAQRRSAIDDLLSSFLSDRMSQRTQQQAANRQAINDRIAQITQQYQSQYGI